MERVLTPWGFDERDETVYRAILRHPGATIDELGRELSLPDEQVLRAARKLIRSRLVRRRGAGVAALRPDLALATLVEQAEDDLAERRGNLTRIEDTITQFAHDYVLGERDHGAPPPLEPVTGSTALAAVVTDLVREHAGEVVFMVRAPVGDMSAPVIAVRAAQAAGRRLRARSVHAADTLDGTGSQLAAELAGTGAGVRVVPRVPVKALLFRGRALLLKADADRPELDDVLVVRAPAVLAALQFMFELLWDRGTPLRGLGAPSHPPDRQLLALLAAGCHDDLIARELGVSVRTVRRRIAELLDGLGARTRFQAGAQAARRGLL